MAPKKTQILPAELIVTPNFTPEERERMIKHNATLELFCGPRFKDITLDTNYLTLGVYILDGRPYYLLFDDNAALVYSPSHRYSVVEAE